MTSEENEDKVISFLTEIKTGLEQLHREPNFIPYIDLLSMSGLDREELNKALNNLYLKKKIKVHIGLNDKLIELL